MKHINYTPYIFAKTVALMVLLMILSCFTACNKAIDAGPPKTALASTTTFSTLSGATSAMLGIYTSLEGYQNVNTSTLPGLSADELISYGTPVSRYYNNSLNATINDDIWSNFYQYIYQVNNLVLNVNASSGIRDEDKRALIGEAEFLRAFFHFYLVNYFGDVPYLTTPDYKSNALAVRMSSKNVVYPLIIQDLLAAQAALPTSYPVSGRVRANKAVATAMMARVYLYIGDWANAEKAASTVISDSNYNLETDISKVFLVDSRESILQLSPNVTSALNAAEGFTYILKRPPSETTAQVALSDYLYGAFEAGDSRKIKWTGTYTSDGVAYHFAYKYKNDSSEPTSEYSVVLRLAEQYLIRAEARARQGKVGDAVNDINPIRLRAGLEPLPTTLNQADCINKIMQERRIELFTEWGHRWFDLKRTGTINQVMQTVCAAKGGSWKPDWALYPIPIVQINTDRNMTGQQNPGY